jgi:hypothetical protein
MNAPAQREVTKRLLPQAYDSLLDDTALRVGVSVAGNQRLRFEGAGRHLLEVFIANPEKERFPFRLVVNGRVVDERPLIAPGPGRMRPKGGSRHTALLAMVQGPADLAIQSDAPGYVVLAVRSTPAAQVESELAPKWRSRLRELHERILTQGGGHRNPTVRRAWMQQIADRLEFSSNEEARKEGLLGRARAWFWVAAENHEPDDLLQTRVLLERALKVMPENPVVRQMISSACLGQVVSADRMPVGPYCKTVQPVPWKVEVPPGPAGAPEWAVAQRDLMRRMDAITEWWVEKRQADNGELGGGWGDDVEILRHWGPQALGFGSAVAARGIANVAGGLWNSGTLLDGYDRGVSDVEHSSAPTTDTQPLAAALNPGNFELLGRLRLTAACADNWLKPQPDGALRFRSSWFNCRDADTSPARAVDVHLNTRAMGPALWYAYLTRDPHMVSLITKWTDAWIAAMRSEEGGKPKGAIPPVMRSKDGSYLIGSKQWDKPEAEWDYFQWRGESQESVTSLMLAAYDLSGDRKYLDAATESFAPMLDCKRNAVMCEAMRKSPSAFYAWRRLTGDRRYDAAFGYQPAAAEADTLRELARLARQSERRFAVNRDMVTSEVLYTDRVYYPLSAEYRVALFGGEAPRGDRYPSFAVTWPAVQSEFARAVLQAGAREVKLKLYSFEAEVARVPVRLWRLERGRYSLDVNGERSEFTVDRLPHVVEIPLPAGREVTARIDAIR